MSVVRPAPSGLDDWLDWQLGQSSTPIELGLERVAVVADRLQLRPFPARTVVVAGTNGKGSTAAYTEMFVSAAGRRVGVFSSPHMWRYNERFRIDGQLASDDDICGAFTQIEAARGDVHLTYFEYSALAALVLFRQHRVDVAILEVGLGGRLDAVNIIDADVAVVTSIALDHCAWLGDDREQIGREKAGVFRRDQMAIGCDRDMPASVIETAARLGTSLRRIGVDFDLVNDADRFCLVTEAGQQSFDGSPSIVGENLAGAAMAAGALGHEPSAALLAAATNTPGPLRGRCEFIDESISMVYDVAHNVAAIEHLVARLQEKPVTGTTYVVLAMLKDKPIEAVTERLQAVADCLCPAALEPLSERGAAQDEMAARTGLDVSRVWRRPADACRAARATARAGDRIVVCGSFHTVADTRNQNRFS